jgi:hypothetical protein
MLIPERFQHSSLVVDDDGYDCKINRLINFFTSLTNTNDSLTVIVIVRDDLFMWMLL